jgi:transcriptional regulator with XRE-family HTH domain
MEKLADLDRGPNPIDRHVGLRIRMRRKELGISQEKLAESIGLTFQQVQKYERAANRVSASKLWEMARALNTSVAYFYEGLGEAPGRGGGQGDGSGVPAHARGHGARRLLPEDPPAQAAPEDPGAGAHPRRRAAAG